jgi:hypothetical protein
MRGAFASGAPALPVAARAAIVAIRRQRGWRRLSTWLPIELPTRGQPTAATVSAITSDASRARVRVGAEPRRSMR